MKQDGSRCKDTSPRSKVFPSKITCQSEIGLVLGSNIAERLYSMLVNLSIKVGMSLVSSKSTSLVNNFIEIVVILTSKLDNILLNKLLRIYKTFW